MTKTHWMLAALFMGGLASTLGGLHSWSEALSPAFVAGAMMQASAAILALFSDKPGDPKP